MTQEGLSMTLATNHDSKSHPEPATVLAKEIRPLSGSCAAQCCSLSLKRRNHRWFTGIYIEP
jgi:hypothetical protein